MSKSKLRREYENVMVGKTVTPEQLLDMLQEEESRYG